jgi:hypothetical protein
MSEDSPIFDNLNNGVETSLLEVEYEFASIDIKEYETAMKEEKRRNYVLAQKNRFLKEQGDFCVLCLHEVIIGK